TMAIAAMYTNLEAVMADTTAIAAPDSGFTSAAQEAAQQLHELLENKANVFFIHDYMDFLSIFKSASLSFQQGHGLLVDRHDVIEKIVDKMQIIAHTPGLHVTKFLFSCTCFGNAVITPEDFFSCEYPLCKGQGYRNTNQKDKINYANLRTNIYASLVKGIRSYFNIELLQSFDLFNPSKFESSFCRDDPEFDTKWNILCSFSYSDQENEGNALSTCVQAKVDWKAVTNAIKVTQSLVDDFHSPAYSFWPLALTHPNVPWTAKARDSYQSTGHTFWFYCERSFSHLNNVKAKSRSRLNTASVDTLLRIKINGPKDVRDLDAQKYASVFIAKHSRVDDITVGGRHSGSSLKSKSESV
ncbi:unnamed protein product, partial [Allacma fusca]